MGLIDDRLEPGALVTSLHFGFNTGRGDHPWWLQFGLACCGIEMVAASMARWDMCERFGMWYRPTPRQADLMFVAGTVTKKMAPVVRTLYDQMPEPKWVIAMGSCACSGGPFDTYAVVQGVDQIIPVDIYVPGCPPTPEALYYGVLMLQNRIIKHETMAKRQGQQRQNGGGPRSVTWRPAQLRRAVRLVAHEDDAGWVRVGLDQAQVDPRTIGKDLLAAAQ